MEKQYNLINISHVSEEKGVKDYIKIASKLKKQFNVKCFWIGDGDLLSELKNSNVVIFVGKKTKNQKLKYFSLSNPILISTSYFEGFCIPIAEGALEFLPTVSYNIPEIISVYGKYHNIVNYKNVNSLYNKIVKIIKNYDHYKKRSSKLREFIISKYSIDSVNEKLQKILWKDD